MRSGVDGQAVNLRLDRNICQFPEMHRIVHLEDRDGSAGTGHVDTAETWIEHHDVRAFCHRQVGDRLVRVEIEDCQDAVALA